MERPGPILLRIAVAFAFLYPPFDAVSHPDAWISYFPQFMLGHISDTVLLTGWGVLSAGIALWILLGKKIFIPSVLATVILLLIVLFNLPVFEVVFRDVSIALVSATLAWWSRTTRTIDS